MPDGTCIHYSETYAYGCKLALRIESRTRDMFNEHHGWETGVPLGDQNDWKEALCCTNYNQGLLTCPFWRQQENIHWYTAKRPGGNVLVEHDKPKPFTGRKLKLPK